ncbi:hypothetical protein ZIOFF_060216 [Zingiber officinale]|uniref:beta-galactosidase n=1 Tax=Zingiber officinale TaxID=94328 RepID=A0A8J5FBE4_ZINOF|nr:hypothetical protein ZIOFF_060216 [Zingiber officinale]
MAGDDYDGSEGEDDDKSIAAKVARRPDLGFSLHTSFLPPVAFSPSHGAMCHQRVKTIVINGQTKILISGSIHYRSSTPEMTLFEYNFEGGYALVRFIKTIQKLGLYIHLRIGPYVYAEWNFGLVKMSLESASEQTMNLSRWLCKIENEYGPKSKAFGIVGHAYLNWAAQKVVGLGTGVPWVMCKEDDAPDPVVGVK